MSAIKESQKPLKKRIRICELEDDSKSSSDCYTDREDDVRMKEEECTRRETLLDIREAELKEKEEELYHKEKLIDAKWNRLRQIEEYELLEDSRLCENDDNREFDPFESKERKKIKKRGRPSKRYDSTSEEEGSDEKPSKKSPPIPDYKKLGLRERESSVAGSLRKGALHILQTHKKAMTGGEILQIGLASGMFPNINGKTPENTLRAQLYTDMKKKGENSKFVLSGRGLFGLREWESKSQ